MCRPWGDEHVGYGAAITGSGKDAVAVASLRRTGEAGLSGGGGVRRGWRGEGGGKGSFVWVGGRCTGRSLRRLGVVAGCTGSDAIVVGRAVIGGFGGILKFITKK